MNYCNFPEPNLDPPDVEESWSAYTDDLLEACDAAVELWPHVSIREILASESVSYEDWTCDWDDDDATRPSREVLAPFLEALKDVYEMIRRQSEDLTAWECSCRKRSCSHCGE